MDIKYSNDKRVAFYEDSHSYILDGEKKLTSVTQYLSQFKAPFDKNRISKAYAKKHKRTQKDVLLEWENKGAEACTMGTYVHNIFEDFIEGKQREEIDVVKYPKSKIALKIIEDLFVSERLTPVETELIVYTNEFAGQIDCIAKDQKGDHYILDWKTNKVLKTTNYFQSMTGKFSHLEDCNFNHYSIQLNAYQSMCKEYDIKGCYIVHIGEDDYNIIETIEVKPF